MKFAWLALGSLAVMGCVPDFDDRPWLVDTPRVLSIVVDPPEARPNDPVELRALVVSPEGELQETPVWDFCTRPRTAAERTAVSETCLRGESLMAVPSRTQVLPDACARFGPNPPPTTNDAPPQRPADPDPTGGYFLPIRASLPDTAEAFGGIRVRCDLAGVTRAIFDDFEDRYIANEAPQIESFAVADASTDLDAGDEYRFEVVVAFDSAETYARYDASAGRVVDERERLTISWFVTDGELVVGRSTLSFADGERPATTTNTWQAPESAGPVYAWVVVQDSRGAATWSSLVLNVQAPR